LCIYWPHVSAIKFIGPVILDRSNKVGWKKNVHTRARTRTYCSTVYTYTPHNTRVCAFQSSYKIITVTETNIIRWPPRIYISAGSSLYILSSSFHIRGGDRETAARRL
jgi:hypothetical protein